MRCLVVIFAGATSWMAMLVGSGQVAAEEAFRMEVAFSRGADLGQNWGTLFEIVDGNGRAIAGAGYLGAYNTYTRSDRERLQIFVRNAEETAWRVERLPDVDSPATGFYPFALGDELYLAPRGGSDARVFQWNESARQWRATDQVPFGTQRIAGKVFHCDADRVKWDERPLISAGDGERLGECCFAHGRLVVRVHRTDGSEPANVFRTYAWSPEADAAVRLEPALTLKLPQPKEFVYAFGPWEDQLLAATNMGGVYSLGPRGWRTLRPPSPGVSYQVYSALNYRDRLWLGHYPSGFTYEFGKDGLKLLEDWPPAMKGVSSAARELQTFAIYGGDVYAGVWPWGEVWRYDGEQWHFANRFFSHPEPSAKHAHPYEAETKGIDPVLNLWGQRITGLVPHRESLIVTTSSKTGAAWEPKFDFLKPEQRRDYGAVYRATLPGQLAIPLPPTRATRRLTLEGSNGAIDVRADGELVGRIAVSAATMRAIRAGRGLHFRSGLFGPSRLNIDSASFRFSGE